MSESFVDVALVAYGGPGGADEIPAFLQNLMGREPSAETLAVVQERYALIGGASPLPAITARQAQALQTSLIQQLGFPLRVRHGFLFSSPTIAECVAALDGGHELLALPMSPFTSRFTSDRYRRALEDLGRADVPLLEGWHAGRGFVSTISKRVAEALDGHDASEWAVVFTAHNVPLETITEGDPYAEQLQQTVAQVVPAVMPGDWRFAFQSKGRGGGEWLGPEVDDVVRELARAGWQKLLVVPVGFVSDNVETLYDLDIVLRGQVEGLGMEYRRSAAPNDSPRFIEALADVVIDYLARRPLGGEVHLPGGPHDHGG
jgi:protoporphyrin/coproporphyrin ferrochelatase